MSLLSDIRFFSKKFIKNPILLGAVAYTIYVLLSKHMKKESLLAESITIVEQKDGRAVIYDDTVKKYILVDHDGGVYSSDEPESLLKMLNGEK